MQSKTKKSAFFMLVSSKTRNSVHFPLKLPMSRWRPYSVFQVLSLLFVPFLFNLHFFLAVLTTVNCPYSLVAFGSFLIYLPLILLVFKSLFCPLLFPFYAVWTKKHVIFSGWLIPWPLFQCGSDCNSSALLFW
jgi:hypothetical protein